MKKGIFLLCLIFGIFFLRWDVQRRYFDLSQIENERKELRILVLHRKGIGEKESSARLQTACKHLGWECYICSSRPSTLEKALLFHPLEKAIAAIQPDLTINFQSAEKIAPGINFVSLSSGVQHYASANFDWKKYSVFDAFLPTFQETGLLKEKIESLGKPYYGMRWLFSCPSRPFAALPTKGLFYCGSNWDSTRKGEKIRELFSLLDQRCDLSIYGPKNAWKHAPRSYRTYLPPDGQSLILAMQECGIVLMLHSDSHLKGNAPTGRIFEAAAASCVIISDRHPFVIQEFGDSVLYIDQEESAEEMARQIEAHLGWIRSHPSAAQEMARKCHQIFEEKFTLEQQLLQLQALYDQIQLKKEGS